MTFAGVVQQLAPLGGPLVGREEEMDALRRAWADAAHGVGRTVLLAGEPGVGKTRLAAELAGEVDAKGAAVLVGACLAGGAEPYHPLVEALGALPTAERDRAGLLDALADAVVARARRAPVLLVLDDLHRADRSTLLAVRRLVEVGARSPLLIVATYRDTGLDRSHPLTELLSAVLADPRVERICVESLSVEAVAEMVGDTELDGQAGPHVATPNSGPVPDFDFTTGSLYDALDGDPEPATDDDDEPLPIRREQAEAIALLRARHVALAGPEHVGERLAAATDMVALAEEAGDEEVAATGRGWRLVDALQLGHLDQVDADRRAHADLAHRLGRPAPAADAAAWSAMRALLDGRADDARSSATDAFELAVEAGDPEADASFLVQRWWLALEWGTPMGLSHVIDECRERASTGADGGMWRTALALALARDGRLDLAAEELRRVTDHGLGQLVRTPARLHPLAVLAEVAWMVGDARRAAMVGPLLEPFAAHLVVAGRGLVCQGSAARACGMVAASAHRWNEAQRHFEVALAVHRRIGARPLLARTQFEWSTVLLQRARKIDRRRAADWRRKSAELAETLGMSRLLEEIAVRAT